MEYNFGPEEERLRQEMPYQMSEEKWNGIQQRLKARVLQEREPVPVPPPRRKLTRFRIAIAAAAGLALLLSLGLWVRQGSPFSSGNNAEQQLDIALSKMNDSELDWVHLLNEPEVNEPYEYQ